MSKRSYYSINFDTFIFIELMVVIVKKYPDCLVQIFRYLSFILGNTICIVPSLVEIGPMGLEKKIS